MKKNIWIAGFALTALVACKDATEKEEMIEEDTMETVEENSVTAVNAEDTQQVSYSPEQATEMQRDFEESVSVENNRATNIQGWTIYTTVDQDIDRLVSASSTERMTAAQQLRADYNVLMTTIPAYLRVRSVNRAIEDVDKEITEFEKEFADPETKEKENRENLEEIQEAYEDLAEEIADAREKYVENKEDAMEEYLEEVNDLDSGQTTDERYRDAREEYNEEMDDN
jgi:hypothetical protein